MIIFETKKTQLYSMQTVQLNHQNKRERERVREFSHHHMRLMIAKLEWHTARHDCLIQTKLYIEA